MPKMVKDVDLELISRLEDKVKRLVDALAALKGEHARAVEDNRRLARELEGLTTRVSDAETAASELVTLREEREQIKRRVADMLDQLDGLDL